MWEALPSAHLTEEHSHLPPHLSTVLGRQHKTLRPCLWARVRACMPECVCGIRAGEGGSETYGLGVKYAELMAKRCKVSCVAANSRTGNQLLTGVH